MPPKRSRVDSDKDVVAPVEATSTAVAFPPHQTTNAATESRSSTVAAAPDDEDDPEVDPSIVRSNFGDIPTILTIELMKPQPEHVARALETLNGLLSTDHRQWRRHRTEACRLGAHCMICATMIKWRHDRGVQEWGCFCIQSLSYIDANEDVLIDCGAIEAIVNALKNFPTYLGVQWAGCGALRNLLSGFGTSTKTKQDVSKRFVQYYVGLDIVVKSMKQFPDDKDLLVECFVLFQNLAPQKEYRSAMIEANVPSAAAATLKYHSKESKSNMEALECLLDIFDNYDS